MKYLILFLLFLPGVAFGFDSRVYVDKLTQYTDTERQQLFEYLESRPSKGLAEERNIARLKIAGERLSVIEKRSGIK